jgi:hypothetical protein
MMSDNKGLFYLAVGFGFGAISGIVFDRMFKQLPTLTAWSAHKNTAEANQKAALQFIKAYKDKDTTAAGAVQEQGCEHDDITATDNYSCCVVGTARELYASNHSSPLSNNLQLVEAETRDRLQQVRCSVL